MSRCRSHWTSGSEGELAAHCDRLLGQARAGSRRQKRRWTNPRSIDEWAKFSWQHPAATARGWIVQW